MPPSCMSSAHKGPQNTQGWMDDILNENKEQHKFYMLFCFGFLTYSIFPFKQKMKKTSVCFFSIYIYIYYWSIQKNKYMKSSPFFCWMLNDWIMHRPSIRPNWTFFNRKYFRYLISTRYSNRVIWESSHRRGNFLESDEKLGKSCFDLAIFYYLLSKTATVKVITWQKFRSRQTNLIWQSHKKKRNPTHWYTSNSRIQKAARDWKRKKVEDDDTPCRHPQETKIYFSM